MQFKKQDIRKGIIAAARNEFLEKGFEKASVRNITAAAHTSKSNIYNYFQNKDDLFGAVVAQTLVQIESGLERLQAKAEGNSAKTYPVETQKEIMGKIVGFVFDHQDDLKLLLFNASGSSQAGFTEWATNRLAAVMSGWVRHVSPERAVSDFFIQMVARFYVGSIGQILARYTSAEQAAAHLSEFLRFAHGGWRAVLK